MILADLRRYLQEREEASLADLALHFDADPEVVRSMLELWINKGKVERCTPSETCGVSCNRCDPTVTEIYRWTVETNPI